MITWSSSPLQVFNKVSAFKYFVKFTRKHLRQSQDTFEKLFLYLLQEEVKNESLKVDTNNAEVLSYRLLLSTHKKNIYV